MRNALASATELKFGTLFLNPQKSVHIHTTLIKLVHLRTIPSIMTYNSTNHKCKPTSFQIIGRSQLVNQLNQDEINKVGRLINMNQTIIYPLNTFLT